MAGCLDRGQLRRALQLGEPRRSAAGLALEGDQLGASFLACLVGYCTLGGGRLIGLLRGIIRGLRRVALCMEPAQGLGIHRTRRGQLQPPGLENGSRRRNLSLLRALRLGASGAPRLAGSVAGRGGLGPCFARPERRSLQLLERRARARGLAGGRLTARLRVPAHRHVDAGHLLGEGGRHLRGAPQATLDRLELQPRLVLGSFRGVSFGPGCVQSSGSLAHSTELADALAQLEAEQNEAASTAAGEIGAVGEAARRLDAARAERDTAERAEHEARLELEAIEGRLRRATEVTAALVEEMTGIDVEMGGDAQSRHEAPAGETSSTSAALEELERAALRAREARAEAATARDAAREAWRSARAEADRAEQSEVSAPRAVLEARRLQLTASRPVDAEALRRIKAERDSAQAAYDAGQEADETAAAERAVTDEAREEARTQLIALEREAGGGAARLAELERAAQLAAVEASRHEDALAALARERELALESLAAVEEAGDEASGGEASDAAPASPRRTRHEEPIDPQLAAEIAALDDSALGVEGRRVRRTLAQIGSVNPFAVEEHAELATRLDELVSQDSDLTGAIGSTEELVATLDAQIAGQFNAAFAAIGERFDEFCRLLFAGGSASLQLGEGEDGDAPGGIEIVVRPPGKRLQRLAMLSGGERALTGVALLFAMLSVNPVPFCILDEVDAALDEANIGRFADALRHLAERTDFVVITHNRATIEVADTIYGVTMTDAAVSRVVSLRLADLPAEVLAG